MFVGEVGPFNVAELSIWAFWIFFVLLVLYLRMEDRREGYPLEGDLTGKLEPIGPVAMPNPKTFNLPHGGTYLAPNDARDTRAVKAERTGAHPGSPLEPTGNPLVDAVGPAAYAERSDAAELSLDGKPRMVQLSKDTGFWIPETEADPRGMSVVAKCGTVVGTVSDVWVDRSESLVRYLEVDLKGKKVLTPVTFVVMDKDFRTCYVQSLNAKAFADVPTPAKADQITLREEDRIQAYYAGGTLYC